MNKKYKYLIIVLLIVASFIAFGRIMGNDFVNYDDDGFITDNSHIKTGFNTESIKWAFTTKYYSGYLNPTIWLSYMLDWSLFGANASGYHLVSLLWHIGAVLFLFLFLNKATKQLWPSAFVAALFALHPLRVESVAWVAERRDVMSVFFGMATLYTYAYYAEKPQLSKYFLCLILFFLALLSKPMLVTLPFVLLLLDYWPMGRWQKAVTPQDVPALVDRKTYNKKNKKIKAKSSVDKKITIPAQSGRQLIRNLLWEKVPFFFLALIYGIIIIWQLQEKRYIISLQQVPFSDRIANAIVSYVAYLGKTFWPVDLAVFYPYVHSLPILQVLGASSVLLAISGAVVYFSKRAPFLAVGWLWYLGTLFPVSGLMQAGAQAMADRYSYFPSVGIGIMIAWGIVCLLPKEKMRKTILFPSAGIVLAILSILTWQQCGYWKNSVSLFNHALKATKDNWVAYTNLGFALAAEGKNEEAIVHYRSAIKVGTLSYKTHTLLGIALAAQGKNEEAIACHLKAFEIQPESDETQYNLAVILQRQGKIEEAITHYREALRINPFYYKAHNNLGICLADQFKYDEAIYHYQLSLRIDPNDTDAYCNLGVAHAKKGEFKEAIKYFQKAIYLNPKLEVARRDLWHVIQLEQQRQKR